jgi:hypothetical protein
VVRSGKREDWFADDGRQTTRRAVSAEREAAVAHRFTLDLDDRSSSIV